MKKGAERSIPPNLDHAYDEYLKSHAEEILLAIPQFQEKLKNLTFQYGRFLIPAFYKAYFLMPKQQRLLKRVSNAFFQILNTATRLYFEENRFSHLFHIPQEAKEIMKIDPGYSQSVVFSRFDGLLEGEGLKFVEFNCDSPAGAAYTDQLEKTLLNEKSVKSFAEEHHLLGSERVQPILKSLLAVYEEFGGYETPHIAIVDWRHVRTKVEFIYIKDYFESKGYKTTIADPRELQYRGGKLYHKNFRIDLIYRRALFDELWERIDEVEDLIKAYRDKAVCMANPLRSRLAGSKAMLSLLTTAEFDHFFTENENKMKRGHLPWTRRIMDAEDFYGHKKVYLLDFLKDEKETLVLKPASGHGGRDVYVGKETPDKDWNSAVAKALKGSDWVMQEHVNVPMMTVPTVVNQQLDFAYKKYNFNIFVFGGKYSGSVVRLSDESVINVARGGGLMTALYSDVMPDSFSV